MRLGTVNSTLTRGYGTLAGLGIIGAAILAVPSTLLLDPLPPPEAYFATVAGLVSGLVCMALPWERMDARWLHLVGVVAIVEAAWAVEVFGPAYMAFFFLIAVAVAYVTPDPRSLILHLALVAVALAALVAYGSGDAQSTIQMALVVYPLMALTSGIFAYLRQRMVADHRSYRLFAEETVALSNRIAGRQISAQQHAPSEDIDELPALSRFHVSARVTTAVACILSLPLLTSGLATAGVKVPAFASDALGNVGIELPNQDSDGEDASAPADVHSAGGTGGGDRDGDGGAQSRTETSGQGAGSEESIPDTNPMSGTSAGTDDPPPSVPDPLDSGAGAAPGAGDTGGEGDSGGGDPLTDPLEDTVNGLGGDGQ